MRNWKEEMLNNLSKVFEKEDNSKDVENEKKTEMLLKTIGELKVDNDFLKKS